MQIDGYTRLAAVVATPIKHSISPFIHNYAFEKTGVNGVYVAWDIPESELQVTLKNIISYQSDYSMTCPAFFRTSSGIVIPS